MVCAACCHIYGTDICHYAFIHLFFIYFLHFVLYLSIPISFSFSLNLVSINYAVCILNMHLAVVLCE